MPVFLIWLSAIPMRFGGADILVLPFYIAALYGVYKANSYFVMNFIEASKQLFIWCIIVLFQLVFSVVGCVFVFVSL